MNPFALLDFHLPHRFSLHGTESKYFDQVHVTKANDEHTTLQAVVGGDSPTCLKEEQSLCNTNNNNGGNCSPCNTMTNIRNNTLNNQSDGCCLTEEDSEILNCYYSSSMFLHVIARQELERFLQDSSSNSSKANTLEMIEMMTLYYSIKATCELQMGRMDKYEISGMKAMENLVKLSSTNLAIAGSYLNMCLLELWNDRFDIAKLYFAKVMTFKPYFENASEGQYEYKLLKDDLNISVKLLEYTLFNADVNNLHHLLFERFLVNLPTLFSYYRTGQALINEWNHILKNPHLINSSNCMQVHMLILTLLRDCKKYEEDTKGRSENLTLLYDFLESGITLALLSKCSEKTPMIEYTIESSAKRIVKSIKNPNFESAPFEVIIYLSFAAEHHLKRILQGVLSRDSMNYVEMLRDTLNAYKSLQSRFKIANFYYYGGVFQQVDLYFCNKA
ncbi:predicted protein [Naegleria gruberi]|uniref:Predicted protein n=1 Tax=Naegleria gruberi TaxID=5762 RepID=D2VZM4_NAEGR|nr:uncharacterized protein NAEGRDRAFT_74540 [Naegleria gruberi]EFC37685.1 predicted protein [Naegleria gruberi]|eukprot:XP_002670429.1 predicted protein [Naegleria gruberi strain NEG-M]